MKWIAKLKEAVLSKPDRSAADAAESSTLSAEKPLPAGERLQTLTPREREVFDLLVQGKKMREAAEILGVKLTTISFHSTALYKKLDVHDRAQLILRYALADGARAIPLDEGGDVR